MVVNTCNPTLRRWREEDLEFENNRDYIAGPSLKTKQTNKRLKNFSILKEIEET
jgi:hypothetical protein